MVSISLMGWNSGTTSITFYLAMSFPYYKPPVYYYQTFDRGNLKFTDVPLYTVHPAAAPPEELGKGNASEGAEKPQDVVPAPADEISEAAPGMCDQSNEMTSQRKSITNADSI